MSSSQTGTDTIVICTDCGYQQTVAMASGKRIRSCQNCSSELRFEREFTCPHCRKAVSWNSDLSQCPHCEGEFAAGIPLRPKASRTLSMVLTSAMDVVKAKQRELKESDARRRSEELYRLWAAVSRNDDVAVEQGPRIGSVRPVGAPSRKRPTPWHRQGAVWAGVAAVVTLTVLGGVAAWRSAAKGSIEERLNRISDAAMRADGRTMGGYYGGTLVRFQGRYDVPHQQVERAVSQVFRDYPFVIRYGFTNRVFESISLGEVSVLVDQEWELGGNDTYSGSERHRLIWRKESGAWCIVSQELIKTHWSRKSEALQGAAAGTALIGVQP